jgi:hypothetical protein
MKAEPGTFPAGVIIGSVEIIDCKEKGGEFLWILANSQRLKTPLVPETQPQPVWFKPFKE